jgi:hypothetical protein
VNDRKMKFRSKKADRKNNHSSGASYMYRPSSYIPHTTSASFSAEY